MMQTWTEEELLAILEEHLPQDLTSEQIEAINSAAQNSPKLREAILESLGFEQALAASYAPEPLTAGELIRRCQSRARQQRRGRWNFLARSVLAIAIICALSVGVWAIIQRLDSKSAPIAQRPPAADHQEPRSPSQPGDTDRNQEGSDSGLLADSTLQPTDVAVVEPPAAEPLPDFEPAWRMYDDPALRGDQAWHAALHKVLLPVDASVVMRLKDGQLGLDGTYMAMPPKPDGRRMRLAFSELDRLQWHFWQKNGTDGVLVRWDAPAALLRAFSVHREKIPERNPRFSSEATGLDFLRGDALTRIDRNIDFTWNRQNLPLMEVGAGSVLARWRGLIRFPDAGNWTFAVTTKGKVSIHLDGNTVLYRQASSASETSLGSSIYFSIDGDPKKKKPAVRDIEIQYLGDPQGDGLRLEWERPLVNPDSPTYRREAIARHVVPPDALFVGDGEDAQQGLSATYVSSPEGGFLGPIEIGHLIADDASMWSRRFDRGPLDIYYEAGAIRFARGDIELLAIPAAEPNQSIMQTQCVLRGAESLRLRPATLHGQLAACTVTTSVHPLSVDQWTQENQKAETQFQIRTVGDGLEFSRPDSQNYYWAMTKFDAAGGCEVMARLDKTTPGTGIVLKCPSADGTELRLMIGEHDGRRVLYTNVQDPQHLRECAERGWLLADRCWIRCEVGLTHMRMSFSNDAENWITVTENRFSPDALIEPTCRLDLVAEYGEGVRVLRLGELKVQQFRGLEGLAEETALAAAKERFAATEDWQASFQTILDSPEEGISPPDWAVACHLATLHQSTSRTAREDSVKALLLAASRANVSWHRLRPALIELPRRLSISRETFSREDLAEVYQAAALDFWKSGRRDELGPLVDAWYQQRWVAIWGLIETHPPEALTRFCLLGLAIEEDWEQLWTAALREEFYSKAARFSNRWIYDDTLRLAIWLQHLAAGRNNSDNATQSQLPTEWREQRMGPLPPQHPLVVDDRSRELESTLQEARIAVDAERWDLAADAVLRLPETDELVTASGDDTLLVSSRIATRQLLESHAPLVEAIGKMQRIGRIRLTRGVKCDDVRLVESVAVQFFGTEVGRAAMAILADRDLSRGEFLLAARRYRKLLQDAEPSQKAELDAKYRLAVAMGGELEGTPTDRPVTLGEKTYSAENFEKMLEQAAATVVVRSANLPERRGVRGANNDYQVVTHEIPLTIPTTKSWDPVFFPNEYGDSVKKFKNPTDLGWASDNGRLFLHQQGHLTAIDTASGKILFEVMEPIESNKEPRNATAHPLVYGEHVIVPFYWGTQSELTCFNRDSGAVVWRRPFDDAVIGSPTDSGGTLLTLSVRLHQGGYGDVVLRRIDPNSGSSLLARDIARVRLASALFQVSRIESHGDRILLQVGCSMICCDSMGNPRWVSPLPYLPPELRPNLLDKQSVSNLLVVDDRVVATAPDSWNIECRDIGSGTLLWRYQDPDLRNIVGQSGDRVIVATGREVLELDTATGQTVVVRSANLRKGRDVRGTNNDDGLFGDGQRLYRLSYADEKKEQLVLQVLEREE